MTFGKSGLYCKSTNFGVLSYLANCIILIIFVTTYGSDVDSTLHRQADAKFKSHQITLF